MLDFAIAHKEQLEDCMRKSILRPENKYYFVGYADLEMNLSKSTWEGLQMVSLDKGNNVIGYMHVTFDRCYMIAWSLGVANSTNKCNVTFSKDFYRFLKMIFEFNMRKIRFKMYVGNPIEKMYDKFITKYGGRIVGFYEKEAILSDGTVCDEKIYEIMKSDYEKVTKCQK